MNISKLFNFFSGDLGVDLGTANTLVYARGRGIVVNEPSVVALNKKTHKVEAIGREAKEMLGRTPRDLVVIEPLKEGVIASLDVTGKMLRRFISQAQRDRRILKPKVVIGVPGEANVVERRAVEDAAYRAGARKVFMAPEAVAAAIGAGLPTNEPHASMVVDLGAGTTDIAVLSLSGIVYAHEVRVAGRSLDEAIIEYIKRRRKLLIGKLTAERAKIEIGSALPLPMPLSAEVSADVTIEAGARLFVSTEHEERAAYVVEGSVELLRDGGSFDAGQLLVFKPGEEITLAAPESTSVRAMLLGGEPMDGKRHIFWNFVSNSKERIEQAKEDWQAGRFASVTGESEFIPLPESGPATVRYP